MYMKIPFFFFELHLCVNLFHKNRGLWEEQGGIGKEGTSLPSVTER